MTISVYSKISTDVKDFFKKTEALTKRYVYDLDIEYFSKSQENINYWSNWESFISRSEFYFNDVKYKIFHKCDDGFHFHGDICLITESHIWKQIMSSVCENIYPENNEAGKLHDFFDDADYSVDDFWDLLDREVILYPKIFVAELKDSAANDEALKIVL